MSEEKTIEELQSELEDVKKQNLEREMKLEKEKLEQAEKEKNEKKEEALREEIRNEVISQIEGDSKVDSQKPEKLENDDKLGYFMNDVMKNKHGMEYESYENMIKKIAHPKHYKGR